jgi:hypothetical protein
LDFLEGRNEELWLPLFSACAVISSDRLLELEAIARQRAGAKQTDELDDFGLRLLSDIRDVFEQKRTNRLATEALLYDINSISESPWAGWSRGRRLDARSLSPLVRPFGIQPTNIQLGTGNVAKDYYRESLSDAWESYLPSTALSSRYNATDRINTRESANFQSATVAEVSRQGRGSESSSSEIPKVRARVNTQGERALRDENSHTLSPPSQ